MLRAIPENMSAEAVAGVDAMLAEVSASHRVIIPLAVESGSRAWGFPSPDSDYDGRFLFVRPTEDYLTIALQRDVIEVPPVGDLDVNGWDIRKALRLILKGNATPLEWLQSPIIYGADRAFQDEFLAFAREAADRGRMLRHYWHYIRQQREQYVVDPGRVKIKRIFYVLRPAMVTRWLRLHPSKAAPPMQFQVLLDEVDPPAALMTEVRVLLEKKAVTRELGEGPIPPQILEFVDTEAGLAEALFASEPPRPRPELLLTADSLVLKWARSATAVLGTNPTQAV